MNKAEYLMWAAEYAPEETRELALDTIKNFVESIRELYGDDRTVVREFAPWFDDMEDVYVRHFCESANGAPSQHAQNNVDD